MKDYDFSRLSEDLRDKKPEVWKTMGWMQSTLNNMPENEDKEVMQKLGAEAIKFYRDTQKFLSMTELIRTVVKVSQLSCLDQGLELRNTLLQKM